MIALLCQMYDTGYLVHFIFILVLLLPVLAFVVSLPAMLGCRMELMAQTAAIQRGDCACWDLTLQNNGVFPLPRFSCRLRVKNVMTGEDWDFPVTGRGVVAGDSFSRQMEATRCGRLECRLERLRVYDCLSLFALPVKAPQISVVLVHPVPVAPKSLTLRPGDQAAVQISKGRSQSGEGYELREYRPGDSMRTIHWKLTAKREELVSREFWETLEPRVVVTFDHFGSWEELERTLDRLAGMSSELLTRQRPHEICWAEAVNGAHRRYHVEDKDSWQSCIGAVLSDYAPKVGHSIREHPLAGRGEGGLLHIHVIGEEADYEA